MKKPIRVKVTQGDDLLIDAELHKFALSFDKGVMNLTGILTHEPATDEVAGQFSFDFPKKG